MSGDVRPVQAPGALMVRLREKTASLHRATEDLPLMRRITAPEVRVPDYRAYLSAMAVPYRVLEPSLYRACASATLGRLGVEPKWPALERDLKALGLPVPEPRDDALDAAIARLIPDESAALGGLYVLEGATLGGRVISGQLARNLGAAANDLSFCFLGARDDPSPSGPWRRFGQALEGEVHARGHDPDAVLSGAVNAFRFVHESLRAHSPAVEALESGGGDRRHRL